jgi:hypothetical protein
VLVALPSAQRTQLIAVSTRESPPHASKIAAIAQIQAEAYAHRHAPIASVAPDSADITPGVAVLMARRDDPPACASPCGDSPGGDSPLVEAGEGFGKCLHSPPCGMPGGVVAVDDDSQQPTERWRRQWGGHGRGDATGRNV